MVFTGVDWTGGMDYDIASDEPVSVAVVRAVSALGGHDPYSMGPLTEVVDPDALDALFAVRNDGNSRIGGRVSFVYENCRVIVDSGEYIAVRPLEIRPRTAGDGDPGVDNAP